MVALPLEPKSAITPPPELIESENLVIRQALAMVIASDDDYVQAGAFLNEVIVVGKKQVEEFFGPHVKRAFDAHRALTQDRATHLEPWERAERIVKEARVSYFREQEGKRAREQQDRERKARELEEERKRQEADAERQRAEAEAERLRQEAERRRIDAEAEAERQRNIAADEERGEGERRAADQRAAEVEQRAARETAEVEQTATAIVEAGHAAAEAIEAEPVHLEIGSAPSGRLTGVARTWKVDREKWDPIAFAKWISENPVGRSKYIGEPAWKLLDAEANQQKRLFSVGGITAGPKYSGRAGR